MRRRYSTIAGRARFIRSDRQFVGGWLSRQPRRLYGPSAMTTMDAMVLREHGGPEVLRLEQLPIPVPGPGQVRVAVRAGALNHRDLWVRRGGPALKPEYPHPPPSPLPGAKHPLRDSAHPPRCSDNA